MRTNRIALLLAALLILIATPAVAQAHPHHHHRTTVVRLRRHHHHHPHHHHHHHYHHRRHHRGRFSPVVRGDVASAMSVGMGDVSSIGCENLPLNGATTVRIIVSYYEQPDRFLTCAQNAQQAGYRVLLAIQYDNRWSVGQSVGRFQSILSLYGPVWAVGVGNEQEGPWAGGVAETPDRYSRIWKQVEPLITNDGAMPVAGEISPWGFGFLQQAAADGLPGAAAYSAHMYPTAYGIDPDTFASFARQHGVQAWATEGLCGPGAWTPYGCQSADALRSDGFTLASEWYADGPAQPVAAPTSTAPPAGTNG